MFDQNIANGLMEFFAATLSRDATRRPDTAEDMLQAWQRVFDTAAPHVSAQDSDAAAAAAELATSTAGAGLTPRAVSALNGAHVTTVGELLALDSTLLNRLVAREAKETRKEITTRYREWTARLGKQQHRARSSELMGLDDAVAQLLDAVAGRGSTRRQAAELLLGVKPGLDAFATATELGEALDKVPQRGIQLLKELQTDWAANPQTATLLDAITDIARGVVTDFGGVAAVKTLTAEIRARLPQSVTASTDPVAREQADRTAGGLLRVALDRLSEHEAADDEIEFVRRRHGRRLALLAVDEALLAAAESAGSRADELVSADPTVVIAAPMAARELRGAFENGYRSLADTAPFPPGDQRLVRLAAAISKHAGVSGRGELHNLDIPPGNAAQVALRGLSQTEALSPSQVRSRISARFPDLDRVPQRPQLDAVIAHTGLGLIWSDEAGQYRFDKPHPASSTTMHTRQPTTVPTNTAGAESLTEQPANHAAVLQRSITERGFLAIGVPIPPDRPGEHERLAQALAEVHDGELLDITGALITSMRELSTRQGVSWDLVRSADAPEASNRDAQGLRTVVSRVMPQLWESLQHRVFDGEMSDQPLILTDASPLARYGHLEVLAKLSDLSAPRRRPVWLVVPQLRGLHGALVDRKPIQLGSPSQFILWRQTPDLARPEGTGTL